MALLSDFERLSLPPLRPRQLLFNERRQWVDAELALEPAGRGSVAPSLPNDLRVEGHGRTGNDAAQSPAAGMDAHIGSILLANFIALPLALTLALALVLALFR